MDIDDLGKGLDLGRAADLTAELPRTSRVNIAINPENAWETQEHLLADIAYHMRLVWWRDGRQGSPPVHPAPPRGVAQPRTNGKQTTGTDVSTLGRLLNMPRKEA